MEHIITIKSYSKGLALNINPDVAWDTILDTLSNKLRSSRQFFGNNKVALSVEGRVLTTQEEEMILDCFEMHSDLDIICFVGKDRDRQDLFDRLGDYSENVQKYTERNYARIYRGNVEAGEILEEEGSLLVIGDIHSGSTVTTGGELFVLGGVYGKVQTIGPVIAFDFSPEKLKISGVRYFKKNTLRIWPGLAKKTPRIAMTDGREVVIRPITKELSELFSTDDK